MAQAKNHIDVNNGRAAIERIGRISDGLIGVGPFKIGLDGILAWVPGVGEVYSLGAGAIMVMEGYKARVPTSVLAQAGLLVSLRTLANVFPILGNIAVDVFRGHRMAAKMLMRAIDETHYVEGRDDPADPRYAETLEAVRSGREKRRIVFLG